MDKPKILDHMRAVVRALHYSIRTEGSCVDWAQPYILFRNRVHPAQLWGAVCADVFESFSG